MIFYNHIKKFEVNKGVRRLFLFITLIVFIQSAPDLSAEPDYGLEGVLNETGFISRLRLSGEYMRFSLISRVEPQAELNSGLTEWLGLNIKLEPAFFSPFFYAGPIEFRGLIKELSLPDSLMPDSAVFAEKSRTNVSDSIHGSSRYGITLKPPDGFFNNRWSGGFHLYRTTGGAFSAGLLLGGPLKGWNLIYSAAEFSFAVGMPPEIEARSWFSSKQLISRQLLFNSASELILGIGNSAGPYSSPNFAPRDLLKAGEELSASVSLLCSICLPQYSPPSVMFRGFCRIGNKNIGLALLYEKMPDVYLTPEGSISDYGTTAGLDLQGGLKAGGYGFSGKLSYCYKMKHPGLLPGRFIGQFEESEADFNMSAWIIGLKVSSVFKRAIKADGISDNKAAFYAELKALLWDTNSKKSNFKRLSLSADCKIKTAGEGRAGNLYLPLFFEELSEYQFGGMICLHIHEMKFEINYSYKQGSHIFSPAFSILAGEYNLKLSVDLDESGVSGFSAGFKMTSMN